MKKKQIVAMLLTAAMSLSAFSAYAMTSKEAVDRVTSFGWVDTSKEDYNAEANVTRADFAEMMAKFANIGAIGGTVSSFSDITTGDERLAYINAVVDRGIMTPYLNNKFDPDGTVTKQQIARAVLTVLGYAQWAESTGGYPSGYTTIALGTDMFDGVGGDLTSAMTYADVIRILANSATISMCEPTVSKGLVSYERNDSKTILTEVYDASSIKGRIIADDITSVTGEYAGEGSVKVLTNDGRIVQLEIGGSHADDYVGYEVTVYYREVNGADTIAYVVINNNTEELVFNNVDIDKYENNTYTYYVDGKRKTARISKDATIIYNGKKVTDISGFKDVSYMYYPRNEQGIVKDGTIKLVSTDGSSNYNLVFIEAADCYVVDHYSASNEGIYLKNNKPMLDLEDEKRYDLFDVDGNELAPKDLAKWDVIEAYKAVDGSYAKYVMVRDTVEGTVELLRSSTDEHGAVKIDGVEYPYDGDDSAITMGVTGVFLLSSTGRVIMMTDEVIHNATFGYIVKAYKEDYEDDVFHVKMLTTDGEMVEYDTASKIKYDGTLMDISDRRIRNVLENKQLDRQLVAYDLVDGKLKTIKLAKSEKAASDDLVLLYSNTQNGTGTAKEKKDGIMYKKNLLCFGGKIMVKSDTKILVVPDPDSEFDNYSIRSISTLRNDNEYKNLAAYTIGTENRRADIIVQEVDGGIDADIADEANLAVVSKIVIGTNPAGNEAQIVYAYVNGALQEIYGEDTDTFGKWEGGKFFSMTTGDIFRYTTDANGVVSSWKLLSNGTRISTLDPLYIQSYGGIVKANDLNNDNDSTYSGDKRYEGRVYDIMDNFVGVTNKSNLDNINPSNGSDLTYFAATNTNVYIYEPSKKDNKVTVGTLDDLETYKSVKDDCSKVYMSVYKGELKDIVIFK